MAKKTWQSNEKILEAYTNEVDIHGSLDHHDHVVGFWEGFSDTKHRYILVSYCANGSLFDLRERQDRPYRELEMKRYLRQILEGLNFIHANRIVHCDLRMENVMVNANGLARIGDFGAALRYDGHRANRNHEIIASNRGTVSYLAPETIARSAFSTKTDVWAVGVMAYAMCLDLLPFDGTNDQHTCKLITDIKYL